LVVLTLLVQGACARGAGSATEAGVPVDGGAFPELGAPDVAADSAQVLGGEAGRDLVAPDADRGAICIRACGLLIEPCAYYTPPRATVCLEDCARRSEAQAACAWMALSFPPNDVSVLCVQVSRCLDLRGQ
jgi:hypothetical protein